MKIKDIKVDMTIAFETAEGEAIGTVVSVEKGWIGVEDSDSGETCKIRAKQVLSIEDDAEEMDEEEGDGNSPLARKMNKYRPLYQKATNSRGKDTRICGDAVSLLLVQVDLDMVYVVAAAILVGGDVDQLKPKYQHLNPGQQKMILGNRIRGWVKAMEEAGRDGISTLSKATGRALKAAKQTEATV